MDTRCFPSSDTKQKRTRQQIEEERIRAESLAVEEKLAQNDVMMMI